LLVNLKSQLVDDSEVWVETLGKTLSEILLKGHRKVWELVKGLFDALKTVAEICPLFGLLKRGDDGAKGAFEFLELFRRG